MSHLHTDINEFLEAEKENQSINVPEANDSRENFSFQKLRGTVVQFEKRQKEHYTNNVKNGLCQNNEHGHGSSVADVERTAIKIEKTIFAPGFVHETSSSKKDADLHKNQENCVEQQTNKTSKGQEFVKEEEDFSFQTLRQRAIEKSNGGKVKSCNITKEEDEEDFSFQKLKERAINPNKSNNKAKVVSKNDSHCVSNPTTPAKRTTSLPKTPIHDPKRVTVPSRVGTTFSTPKKSATPVPSSKGTPFDPNKYKFTPKIRKEEIQATDNSHASVHKLSQWLANDPFDKKKQIVIHKGEQIADKARVFENEGAVHGIIEKKQSRVDREREYFRQGGVSEGKQWLRNAFGSSSHDHVNDDVKEEELGVLDKKRMFEEGVAFKKIKKFR